MAQSILGNHYLGKGTLQKSDQPFDVTLCQKKDLFAFVTIEGKLLGLDVSELSYSAEDRIKLTASDLSKSPLAKGQPLIPPSRLDQGVRFIGAASVRDADQIAVLDAKGNINVHGAESIMGAGSIEAEAVVLSIGVISGEANP
jgi:hypothetical protein